MAQRERLGHLKFMQRARQRELAEAEAKAKRQEEAMSDDQWVAPVGFKSPRNKCVVIIEGDPAPSTSIGRMSLQKFNPAFEVSAEHIGSSQESAGTSVKQPITVGEKSAVVRS